MNMPDPGVYINDTPPDTPSMGQQWMEIPDSGDATLWIYDGTAWFESPTGRDGPPGESVNAYTKDSADAAFQPVGNYALDGASYTKAETKKIVVLTEAEYNALGSKDADTVYFLT